MRRLVHAAAFLLAAGCASHCPPAVDSDARPDHEVACGADEQSGCVSALVAFPVNVVPDAVTNTLVMLLDPVIAPLAGVHTGTLWPLAMVLAPIVGPGSGVADALRGRPFWDTWGVREYCEHAAHHAAATNYGARLESSGALPPCAPSPAP